MSEKPEFGTEAWFKSLPYACETYQDVEDAYRTAVAEALEWAAGQLDACHCEDGFTDRDMHASDCSEPDRSYFRAKAKEIRNG